MAVRQLGDVLDNAQAGDQGSPQIVQLDLDSAVTL
jgi:hypothetical protein